MVGKSAAEAEAMPAVTLHCRNNLIQISGLDLAVHGVYAVGSWAPFEIFQVIDVGPGEEFVVAIDN